jgi:arginyl-tRNA synthetase
MKCPVLVLTRNDGTGLYPLRDIAYTINKGNYGKNIIVLGEDQKLYFEQLKQALILLKKPYPQVVHYSFVLLKDAGKMSTRSGEIVLLEEFISEATKKAEKAIKEKKTSGDAIKVGIGAIKYAMLRNENNKNITFDWEQALSFEGDSGPYLQYSYARASSILRKARKKPGKFKIEKLDEKEIQLVKKILDFTKVVDDAYRQLSPHLIANYSFELAQIFNEFYHACQVIGSKEENFRLKLVEAFRIVLKQSLYLLGIEVMEEM